jgi:hypothetical protein
VSVACDVNTEGLPHTNTAIEVPLVATPYTTLTVSEGLVSVEPYWDHVVPVFKKTTISASFDALVSVFTMGHATMILPHMSISVSEYWNPPIAPLTCVPVYSNAWVVGTPFTVNRVVSVAPTESVTLKT